MFSQFTPSTAAAWFPVVLDFALLVIGAAVIVYALVRRSVATRKPFELSSEKWGTVRMDFVAYLVTVGVGLTCVSLFFRYQGYEGRVRDLSTKQAATDAALAELQTQLGRFKHYRFNVALGFNESLDKAHTKVAQRVKKPGDGVGKMLDSVDWDMDGTNVILVNVTDLNEGDTLDFRVTSGMKTWKSPVFNVPKLNITMFEETKK